MSALVELDVMLPLINEQLSATVERSHGRAGRRNTNISFNQVPSWIGFLPKMNDTAEKKADQNSMVYPACPTGLLIMKADCLHFWADSTWSC